MNTDDLVAIAKVAKPRGLRGEVAADVLTDFPARFEGLQKVAAIFPNGDRKELKIEGFWFQKDRVILKFADFDTIDAAEELRNAEICVPRSEAVELGPDEFFDWQLSGCRVETHDGEVLGTVAGIVRTGGTEVLMVSGGTKEYMVPFAGSICTDVDVDRKVIRIDPPEGLLEF